MKKLANLKGAKLLAANELKEINGGKLSATPWCQFPGDPECCGTGPGQCGVGHCAGGILNGGVCVCF